MSWLSEITKGLSPSVKDYIKWGAIGLGAIVLLLVVGYTIWTLNGRARDAVKIQRLTDEKALVESNYRGLEDELKFIRADLKVMEQMSKSMIKDVEKSKGEVEKVRQESALEITKILNERVPSSCEGKFEWMREKLKQMKERHQ